MKSRTWKAWAVVVEDRQLHRQLYYESIDENEDSMICRYFIYNKKPKSWPEMCPSDRAVRVTITEAPRE